MSISLDIRLKIKRYNKYSNCVRLSGGGQKVEGQTLLLLHLTEKYLNILQIENTTVIAPRNITGGPTHFNRDEVHINHL